MYNQSYQDSKEITGMHITLGNAVDYRPRPPEMLEMKEEPTGIEGLMAAAMSEDERRLVAVIDRLADEAWRFPTGKALRGELRRMWKEVGRTEWGFYQAFHALKDRRMRA